MEFSTPKSKIRDWVSSNGKGGPGFKSPLKLLSPVIHTKTIYLHDWWLMRPEEGDGIAVGGFTMKREGVKSAFYSASIKERHDCSTLESSDGFTIFISGLINMSHTEENGFPPQVCIHFLNGFPLNWKDFASQHVREGSTHKNSCMGSPDGSHTFPSGSFQDMSFHQKRDFLLSAHGLYDEDAIGKHLSGDLFENLQLTVTSPKVDITPDLDLPRAKKLEELQENGIHKYPSLRFTGVRTRRMAKMEESGRARTRTRTRAKTRTKK